MVAHVGLLNETQASVVGVLGWGVEGVVKQAMIVCVCVCVSLSLYLKERRAKVGLCLHCVRMKSARRVSL